MKKEAKKLKKEKVGKLKKKRIIIYSLIAIGIILFIIFGSQIYLFINIILGKDIIINIETSSENIFLYNNQSQEIEIQIKTITNPFCSANCNFSFIDLSKNIIIDKQDITLKSTTPLSKKYILTAPKKGIGQELYRFDIQCTGKKSFICQETEEKSKISLINLNYNLTDEEQKVKQESKNELTLIIEKSDFFQINLENQKNTINQTLIDFQNLTNEIKNLQYQLTNLTNQSLILKKSWENQDYFIVQDNLENLKPKIENIEDNFNNITNSILINFSVYNDLTNNLTETENKLIILKGNDLTQDNLNELEDIINDFNNLTFSLNQKDTLINKISLINPILNKTKDIEQKIDQQQVSEQLFISNKSINHLNLNLFNLEILNSSISVDFKEPIMACPVFNINYECCNESCKNNKTRFPIIFLHGHDFSETLSPEYNLNVFDGIQRALENDYINAGSILLEDPENYPENIWSKIPLPLSLTTSYYFDYFKSPEKTTLLQTKKDNIDTYSIRLKDIINQVKQKTERDKVILIGHSMGGLVIRRYLQIFDDQDVEKVILIVTPNNGIDGSFLKYCSVFGAQPECEDMGEGSLFLNKLNTGKQPSIPVYNIIGIGCNMDGEAGDGVVKNSSTYLDYATNYYINGTCDEIKIQTLHSNIISTKKYPKTLELIKEILKE